MPVDISPTPHVGCPLRVSLVTSVVPQYRLPMIRGLSSVAGIKLSLVTTQGGAWPLPGADLDGLPNVRILPTLVFGPGGARAGIFRGLRRTLDSLDTDVVIAEPRMGLVSVVFEALWRGRAEYGRRGLVWWMAGWRDSDRERWKVLLADATRRAVLRRADAVACYGSLRSLAVSLGLPRDAVIVAQNAIDTEDLESQVEALRSADDAGFATGRAASQSGLRMLLRPDHRAQAARHDRSVRRPPVVRDVGGPCCALSETARRRMRCGAWPEGYV